MLMLLIPQATWAQVWTITFNLGLHWLQREVEDLLLIFVRLYHCWATTSSEVNLWERIQRAPSSFTENTGSNTSVERTQSLETNSEWPRFSGGVCRKHLNGSIQTTYNRVQKSHRRRLSCDTQSCQPSSRMLSLRGSPTRVRSEVLTAALLRGWKQPQLPISGWVDRQNVVRTYHGALSGFKILTCATTCMSFSTLCYMK